MKKNHRSAIILSLFLVLSSWAARASALDEANMDPEDKARRAHELGSSDVIYDSENYKALYYQNLQIIGLLKEIREEMHAMNVRSAGKSDANS
jgi:hypothetical protein